MRLFPVFQALQIPAQGHSIENTPTFAAGVFLTEIETALIGHPEIMRPRATLQPPVIFPNFLKYRPGRFCSESELFSCSDHSVNLIIYFGVRPKKITLG
jgi:hypothetical protein